MNPSDIYSSNLNPAAPYHGPLLEDCLHLMVNRAHEKRNCSVEIELDAGILFSDGDIQRRALMRMLQVGEVESWDELLLSSSLAAAPLTEQKFIDAHASMFGESSPSSSDPWAHEAPSTPSLPSWASVPATAPCYPNGLSPQSYAQTFSCSSFPFAPAPPPPLSLPTASTGRESPADPYSLKEPKLVQEGSKTKVMFAMSPATMKESNLTDDHRAVCECVKQQKSGWAEILFFLTRVDREAFRTNPSPSSSGLIARLAFVNIITKCKPDAAPRIRFDAVSNSFKSRAVPPPSLPPSQPPAAPLTHNPAPQSLRSPSLVPTTPTASFPDALWAQPNGTDAGSSLSLVLPSPPADQSVFWLPPDLHELLPASEPADFVMSWPEEPNQGL